MINKFVSSFELSQELDNYKLPPVIYDGCYVYDKLEQELFVVVDCGNNELRGIPLNSDKILVKTFKENEFIKAYISSEIGEILPKDYTLPISTEDGWAFVSEDGAIFTDMIYETEVEARCMYLLYFLKHKVLTVEQLINGNTDLKSE